MACMVSSVRFREADTSMLYPLVFNCRGGGDMLRVPNLWLLLPCMCIVLIRISMFLDERGVYHYLLQLIKCKRFVCLF